MPAQALIRKLSKPQIDDAIAKLNAGDLLDVTARPDGAFLVRCKAQEGGSVAGSPEALQMICDMDAKIVREEEAKAKAADEAAKKAAAAAAAAAPAPKP